MSRLKKGGALAALAVAVVGGFEGLRTSAYLDSVAVPTVCYGETRGVRLGMRFEKPQCDAMLAKALDEFAAGVERCVPSASTMPETRYVAHLSLAYNIGVGAYCKSSVARLTNAGHPLEACQAFLKWDRAGGLVLPGLHRRRVLEANLCVKEGRP